MRLPDQPACLLEARQIRIAPLLLFDNRHNVVVIRPPKQDVLQAYPVDRRVNKPETDDPKCIQDRRKTGFGRFAESAGGGLAL